MQGGWVDWYVSQHSLIFFSVYWNTRWVWSFCWKYLSVYGNSVGRVVQLIAQSINSTGHVIRLASFFLISFRLNASGSQLFASSGISRLQKTYVISAKWSKKNILCNIKMTSFILNNFILFSSVIIFIIAHRGVEETVAASLDDWDTRSHKTCARVTRGVLAAQRLTF